MDRKQTVYLIDFENTREYGLKTIQTTDKDMVVIVYTANVPRLDLDALNDLHATLRVVRAQTGKQSLDLLLVSYLGYVISEQEKAFRYVIISNDSDYDGVVAFWNNRGHDVSRRTVDTERAKKEAKEAAKEAIQSQTKSRTRGGRSKAKAENKPKAEEPVETRPQTAEVSGATQKPAAKAQSADELLERLEGIFEREKLDPGIRPTLRQLVSDGFGEAQRKSVIYRRIIAKYGQKNGLRYYNLIKKEL